MQFAQISNFHMLTNHDFKLINLAHHFGSNGTVINMHNNDGMLACILMPEEDSLISGALRETKLIYEDFD